MLPAFALKERLPEILAFINANDKSVIVGPTGSGKSLAIPAELSRNGKKVYVSLPTRLAIRSLKQSQDIFHPELDVEVLDETEESPNLENANIVYGTARSIRDKILAGVRGSPGTPGVTFCNYLIIDEAHTGSAENYIVLGLLDYIKRKGGIIPKIVIMSATLSQEQFQGIPRYDIPKSQPFDIEVEYHNKKYRPGDKGLYVDLASMVDFQHKRRTNTLIDQKNLGSFMVFVPGKKEMDIVANALKNTSGVNLILIHSSSSPDMFKRLYSPASPQVRKVIITTNILETAVTIEDVSVVFDSMLEKRSHPLYQGQLITQYISKSSADQRKGRTGRTGPGYVYRMITKSDYELLDEHREEEIYHVNLTGIILSLVIVGINPLEILPTTVHSKIPEYLTEVKSLGLLKVDNDLSDMGVFFTYFNLTPAAFASLWWVLQITSDIGVTLPLIAILHNINQPFLTFDLGETSAEERAIKITRHKETYYKKFLGRSELHTILNMWNSFYIRCNGVISNKSILREWATENKVDYKTFRNIADTVIAVAAVLTKNNFCVTLPSMYTSKTSDAVLDFARPILRRTYALHELMLKTGGSEEDATGGGERGTYTPVGSGKDKITYRFSRDQRLNTYDKDGYPERILAIKHTDRGKSKFIDVSLNVETYQLLDRVVVNPQLLSGYEVKEPRRHIVKITGPVPESKVNIVIDYTKVGVPVEQIPKTMDQLYMPLMTKRMITLI